MSDTPADPIAAEAREITDRIRVAWHDLECEPKCAPDARYPHGIDLDLSEGASVTCNVPVSYPSPRCGYLEIRCTRCGESAAVTTAGRPDDPRNVRLPCYGARFKPKGATQIITQPKKTASAP